MSAGLSYLSLLLSSFWSFLSLSFLSLPARAAGADRKNDKQVSHRQAGGLAYPGDF